MLKLNDIENLNYEEVIASMQTTQRHKDFVRKLMPLLYEHGKIFGIISQDTDFDTALKDAGVYDKYTNLINS